MNNQWRYGETIHSALVRQDRVEQRRRQEQAAAEEADANVSPVNNPPALAAAANPGQAVAALENAQDC